MKGLKVGIDYGSFGLKICTENKPLVVDENSCISVNSDNRKAIVYGKASDRILGRTDEDIETIYVIKNGVIADFTNAQNLLDHYITRVCRNRIYKPNVIITLPCNATDLEKRTFQDAVTLSGVGRVCLAEGVLASALGCGIPTDKLGGRMVIDIGHNVTEIGIISMGTLVAKDTVQMGSSLIDQALMDHLKRDRDIIIGPHTARTLKSRIVFADKRNDEVSSLVNGKSGLDEMPISFEVTSTELYPIIDETMNTLVSEIANRMQKISPELSQDSADHGITLCGGGALLFDIVDRFAKEFDVEFRKAENPVYARIRGIQMLLQRDDLMESNNYSYVFKDEVGQRSRQ